MVSAWYMNNSEEDQRLEHHLTPPQYVDLLKLQKVSGVLYWKIDADNFEEEGKLEKIKKSRGYTYQDIIEVSPTTLPNYDEKLKIFFKEHLHSDEEIRFVLSGGGYFDVRDKNDRWIRVHTTKGDLIVVPAGIYHRFTLDTGDYIKAIRLFVGEPVWTPLNRPAEEHPARQTYLKLLEEGFCEADGLAK